MTGQDEEGGRRNGWKDMALQDLPSAGLQERIRAFGKLEEASELRQLLRTTEVFDGLGVALACSFRILDEHVTNATTGHWDRAFGLFRLLV